MDKFPYENLNDADFEALVISICKEILGIGCKTFSTGKDGGKDSWFEGTAQCFPSNKDSWKGTFCIQAKHTTTFNASCSDNDFSVNQSGILAKEIKRLNEMQPLQPFNNYIIFTTRKLSGLVHPEIVKMLRNGLGIQNAEIVGREQIDTYLVDYPHIVYKLGFYKFMPPLHFNEQDIKDIIIAFYGSSESLTTKTKSILDSDFVDKEAKNALNNLSANYFEFIKERSLDYFAKIAAFLQDPKNGRYTKMYENTVGDLQEIIILERSRFNEFEHILKHLVDYIVQNNEEKLKDLRNLVRVFVHFMYFNCDIGKKK